jgi:hypothetical protein
VIRRPLRPLLVVAPLVVAVAALLSSCARAAPANVGGSSVTEDELVRATGVFEAIADVQHAECGDTASARDADPPGAACTRYTLGTLIIFELAESYADAHGVTVSPRTVTETADRFAQNFGDGALASALAAHDATEADYEDIVRRSLIQDQVAEALAADQAGGESGLRDRYEEALADYTIVQVDHVLVDTEEEARQILDQATAPGFTEQDFLDLAKAVSTDPSVKQNGGALGSAYASTYLPAFRDAVLAMHPGEVAGPVKTRFGWHVIWMVDEEVTPFSEARPRILAPLKGSAFQAFVSEQVAGALPVEVDPRFGRFDPATLTLVAVRSTDPSASEAPSPVNATPGG